MNLAQLKKSRKRRQAGEIFALLPPDGRYLYGRVIATDANAGGFENSNLIYIYRVRSKEKLPIPTLYRGELLVPPIMTNNLPWSRGYFEFLENRKLAATDRLRTDVLGGYRDETGRKVRGPIEPVGEYGLHSFRTIDDEVSRALGIFLAPDD